MFLGFDFGTSGARACAIDVNRTVVHENQIAYRNAAIPLDWREALYNLLKQLPETVAAKLQGIAIVATSATVLLCDEELAPMSRALIYSDSRAKEETSKIKELAPSGHIAGSATSGLAKFLWLTQHTDTANAAYFLHQADWLTALLTGLGGMTDYHNALKSGYDVGHLCWPDWIKQLPHSHLLPHVVAPGSSIAHVRPAIADYFKINPACIVHAGSTDSIAAFIATGASKPGEAVTSLGTTLVLKLLSERRVESSQFGVYSHRYGNLWLAGGASNAGGGVLRQYFNDAQLAQLSMQIDPSSDSPLDYYPLPCPGERFPVNDSAMLPRLEPRPTDNVQFLHGLLQGLSRIEASGYGRLTELGATPSGSVITMGGGAKNTVWMKMREKLLEVPVSRALHTEAAYGAALLAMKGDTILH